MVAMTAETYLMQLQALLPPGSAWPKHVDAGLTKLLLSEADELTRIDARAQQLFDEADPRKAVELLTDWERNYGLPDACMALGATPDERRQRVYQKYLWQGGQSIPFFEEMLAALGYAAATIQEFRPFRADSKCDQALNQNGWKFAWRVNVPGDLTIRNMTCGSPCDSPIRRWGDDTLKCILAMYKPAETIVFVAYGDYA